MLYSGFNILPRSVFWPADLNGRSDNADVIRLRRSPDTMDSKRFDNMLASVFGQGLPVCHDLFDEFITEIESNDIADRIGDAHIVTDFESSPDNHWCQLHDELIPFMWVRQPNHFDYYCFDLRSQTNDDCRVTVFAVDYTVNDWPNFNSFLQWLRIQ